MTRVDTSQELKIFPKPVGFTLIASAIGVVLLGLGGIVLGITDQMPVIAVMSGGLAVLGIWMTWAFVRRRNHGRPDATMMLSPEGLHVMTAATGVIPWGAVNGLSSYSTRQMKRLVINVDEAALAALTPSKAFKASRKFDAAIGVHVLIYYQQQVEVPLHDLADMIHDYSVAHGGPPLQPNRPH